MHFESIQEIKKSFDVRSMIETNARDGIRVLAAGRPQAVFGVGPAIALGAAPTTTAGDYGLAILVQRKELLHGPEVQRLVEAAKGEAVVEYIGVGFKQSLDRTGRARPLAIGCSIGHPSITAGTLGCFVKGPAGVRVLSNNHVLADEDRASIGDAIVQPGVYDGGVTPADIVATLDDVVPLTRLGNRMDAATASLVHDQDYEAVVSGLGALVGTTEIDGTEPVAKLGRTSGLTRGRILALDVDGVIMNYEKGQLSFDGVIQIRGVDGLFSEGGDSGSLVVIDEASPQAVGLHFGALQTGASVVSPLLPILQRLGVTLVC